MDTTIIESVREFYAQLMSFYPYLCAVLVLIMVCNIIIYLLANGNDEEQGGALARVFFSFLILFTLSIAHFFF